jgi:uncharacterized protein YdeI (BOF family)
MPRTSLALFVMSLTIVGCGGTSTTSSNSKTEKTENKPAEIKTVEQAENMTVSLPNAKPDFTFTADEWHVAVNKEPAKYKGKIIEVSGEVQLVTDQAAMGKQVALSLVHFKVKDQTLGFRAACPDASWKTMIPDKKATVRGVSSEGMKGELFPCVVVKSEGQIKTYQASALAKEVIENSSQAMDAHNGEWCSIEGKLIKSQNDKYGFLELIVEGSDGKNLTCSLVKEEMDKAKTIPAGTKIKIFGKLYASLSKDDTMSLLDCRVEK